MLGREILHYRIREKIGEGGMGEVYLAQDTKLDREVAIKFIPSSLQSSPEAHVRLLREAQAASRLVHPNIVAIHAIEKADDEDFIVMEFVRGQTLSAAIASHTLGLEQALDLARQIADALSVAHETGVVHRDIKSSNILLTERGQAKMLDFGLATFYGATQVTDAGSTMGTAAYMSPEQTQGRPIDHRSDLFSFGVVLYEMVTGRRPFEGENRNAISFAICHHIPEPMSRFKTGVPPDLENIVAKALRKDPTERYQSAADMMADIKVAARQTGSSATMQPPPTPSQPQYGDPAQGAYSPQHPATPSTPGGPATPAHPYPPSTPAQQPPYPGQPTPPTPSAPYPAAGGHTTSQPMPPYAPPPTKSRTNMVVIVAIIMGGLIAIAALLSPRLGNKEPTRQVSVSSSPAPSQEVAVESTDDRTKIAVLPFKNLGEKDDEYFAEGVTEEIAARLASVKDLGVIGRTSVEEYKDSRKPAPEIGRELDADYVLEGTVRWQRVDDGVSRVRVTPTLIRVSDGTNVWADVYDEPMTAVFKVQSSISKAVVGQLGVALLEGEDDALESTPTDNMEAYDAYLKGMRLKDNWNSAQDLRVAVAQFEKATSLDPGFLMAYVRMSEVNADMVWFNHDMSEHRIEASYRAAKRALDIDADSPDAQWAMGWYYYHAKRDLKNALRYLEPVLEVRPNSADAHAAAAYVQRRQGRWDDAIANLLRATELDPNDATLAYSVGECYRHTGEFAKSRPYLDRATELRPELPFGRLEKVTGYVIEGDFLNARREARALTEIFGEEQYGWVEAWVEYLLGDYDAYFAMSKKAGPADNNSFYRPTALNDALVYRAIGNDKAARVSFEAARDGLLVRVKEDPNDFRYQGALGMAYAGLGMEVEALRHAERAIEILHPTQDALRGNQRRYELSCTMILLGDYEAAIDQLEIMMTAPGQMSTHLLRRDRIYDPLRELPRFKALMGNS